MKLTESQNKAVMSRGFPTLINAGAGSGKTRVIVEKAARYIESGIPSERIAAITFTKKATYEMLNRLYERVGISAYKAHVNTWHSFALNQIVKPAISKNHPYFKMLGYKENDIVVLSDSESRTLISECSKSVLSASELELLKENGGSSRVQAFIGFQLSFGRGPKAAYQEKSASLKAKQSSQDELDLLQYSVLIWQAYFKRLIELNAVDYDHILLYAVKLLRHDSQLRSWIQNYYLAILADEHQDASPIQGELLKLVAGDGKNLTIVGDDKQSIYAFRAADVEQFLNAKTEYENLNIIEMAENFRSSKRIVTLANAVAELMDSTQKVTDGQMIPESIHEGVLPVARLYKSDEDEAVGTVNEISHLIKSGKCQPSDFAILYRAKVIKDSIEEQFVKSGIEYRVVGDKDFFDAREVKDWVAFLRFSANHKDVMAASRVIDAAGIKSRGVTMRRHLIDKGISVKQYLHNMSTAGTAKSAARKHGFLNLIECHETLQEILQECGSIQDLSKLRGTGISEEELKGDWTAMLKSIEEGLMTIWQQLFKAKWIEEAKKKYKVTTETSEVIAEVKAKESNVRTLNSRLFSFTEDHGHLVDCIKQLNLLIDSGEKESNAVQLMTEHASKGLEFKHVYIVGCEDESHFRGGDTDNEHEEKRLFYVGITRAEQNLTISCARQRTVWGSRAQRTPLRFLTQLPTELLHWQDLTSNSQRAMPFNEGPQHTVTSNPASSNPIMDLRNGKFDAPDLSVMTKTVRVEGFKI